MAPSAWRQGSRRFPFSPCGRRWREAPDEGYLSAATPHPSECRARSNHALSHKGGGHSNRHRAALGRDDGGELYQKIRKSPGTGQYFGRRNMSGNAAAVLDKPAFRKIDWLARDIAVERRGDGTVILKSRIPLQSYATHIPAYL